MHLLLIDKDDDYDDPDIHGTFPSIEHAQAYARAYRELNGIAGHENDDPTEEENEAWTAEGWHFAIVEPHTEALPGLIARASLRDDTEDSSAIINAARSAKRSGDRRTFEALERVLLTEPKESKRA